MILKTETTGKWCNVYYKEKAGFKVGDEFDSRDDALRNSAEFNKKGYNYISTVERLKLVNKVKSNDKKDAIA